MLNKLLAKRLSLVCVLHTLFVQYSAETIALDHNSQSFVVKVGHDDLEALVFLSDQVFNRDFNVLEGDVCGSGGPDALAVHLPDRDTWEFFFDEENGDTTHSWAAGA